MNAFNFCFAEKGVFNQSEKHTAIMTISIAFGVVLIAVIISIIVILRCWRMKKCSHCSESNTESSVVSSHLRGAEKSSASEAALLNSNHRREG